ncbi:MAG: HAD-IIIA family hydrolase, partial [Hamadaea sp.]|nr:HAD-IIIA family hydrolase [Hamadaea sp.]
MREAPSRPTSVTTGSLFDAVLFDRDGTLIRDIPYCDDPAAIAPMPGARAALDRLRAAGLRLGVVSNQSGIGRGLLRLEDVQAVNLRVEQLLGPFDAWRICPHAPEDDCACRKPRPGLILTAAADLGVDPTRCVVVGDIGADVAAAQAAGALG